MAKKKRNRKSIKNNGYKLEELGIQKDDITKEELIDIYADAYYKALKRIENESKSENEPEHKVKKYKKYEWVQYFLNVLFFPWKIHEKFKLKDNIYDDMLTLIISLIMYFIGGFLQLVSLGGVIGIINNIGKLQVTVLLWIGVIVIYCLFFASVIIISAKQFSKEKDSNKIYAVSSIIIALISCIISTVAFVMQFLM